MYVDIDVDNDLWYLCCLRKTTPNPQKLKSRSMVEMRSFESSEDGRKPRVLTIIGTKGNIFNIEFSVDRSAMWLYFGNRETLMWTETENG
ncbi:hypothetical protein AVEN_260557-1 [Araneus ventricosus]|uniref:Uncharacterized protein n=1 Tax=Araneus ventricosus TaxID=182803 RepID=A0A4Y2I3R7_ARAVE|nr:hypothetical protein AVEN_260557-1 [Araneus ventricosus]